MSDFLDERQEKFLNWLVTPPNGRVPSSQAAYALENNIDEPPLRRWKKKPAFKSEWEKRVSDLQGSPERTQALLDNLFQRALEGDNNSAKLYLQATGRLAPVQVNVEHTSKASELSDAELAELISMHASNEQRFRLETKATKVDNGND